MPNTFTKAQESAITHHEGACLVLAGPGSGKTTVITNRLVYMVREHHIPGEHILVITFTKASAVEMEERFKRLMPDVRPWFGTFHSCFYYILRNSYTSIPTRFISKEEKQHILRDVCDQVLGKDFELEADQLERVLSLYMNNGLSMPGGTEHVDLAATDLRQIYNGYHRALAELGYMDFDDMMLCCYQLLKENPAVLERFRRQFQYILIDECQDMNVLQYEIVRLLSGPRGNVFMVGDDDQAIYRFRGARVELMQRFTEEFPSVRKIYLDRNFRSTSGIVSAALRVISQNKNRFVKKLSAENGEKGGVHIKSFELRRDMYEHLLQGLCEAEEGRREGMAIIYRTNQELRNMAYRLRQRGIPYQCGEDRKSIFDEDWYLDVEAYMHLGLGSLDRKYVLRVANKPNRFIKRERLVNVQRLPEPLAVAVKHIGSMRPFLALKYIWNGIGYGRWLERSLELDTEQYDAIKDSFEEMSEEMKNYASLEEWLYHVEEDRQAQKHMRRPENQEPEQGVHLLTMHASKGLEFDRVYLLDVNKGKVPKGSRLSKEELEEERRLFYVAMTRARYELEIYYVKGTKDHSLQPSIFLEPLL